MIVDTGVAAGEAVVPGPDASPRQHWTTLRRALLRRLPLLAFVFGVPLLTLLLALGTGPDTLRRASLVTIAGSVLLLGVIRLAGRLGRRDRRLLLLFLPGLYTTTLSVLVLIPLHAILLTAAMFAVARSSGMPLQIFAVGAVGGGAFVAMIVLVPELFGFLRAPHVDVQGVPIERAEDPRLWGFVAAIAARIGTAPPDNILVGLPPRFFVTEATVRAFGLRRRGRTLYLSLPLCRILSRQELESVIAHELAHFAGDDTRLSHSFAPVYRGASDARAHLIELANAGGFSLALLPAIAIFGYFLDAFRQAERAVSRGRELEADRRAAEVAGPGALGSALVKIHAFVESWQAVRWAYAHGKRAPNASLAFAEIVRGRSQPEALDTARLRRQPHPIDSHPTLEQRLNALGLTLDELRQAALQSNPEVEVLGGYGGIECQLTTALRRELQERRPG